jgi:hypothetical protein
MSLGLNCATFLKVWACHFTHHVVKSSREVIFHSFIHSCLDDVGKSGHFSAAFDMNGLVAKVLQAIDCLCESMQATYIFNREVFD